MASSSKKKNGAASDGVHHYVRSELDIFKKEGYDLSIVGSQMNEYFPIAPLNDSAAPITFNIPGTDTHYLDLAKSRLYLRLKITLADCSDIAATDVVAPVNNICHSLFSQCSVYLNETQITPTSNYYAYRAYLERLLCFSKEFNKTQSSLSGYFKEKEPKNNDETKDDSFKKRIIMSAKSGVFEVVGRPHSDIFVQKDFIPPGIDLRVVLTRTPDVFALHAKAAGAYKLQILEAKMQILKHKIQPAVAMHHIKMWERNDVASIYLNKVDIKTYGLPKETLTSTQENILSGELPSRLVVAIVKTSDMIGDITSNPFVFGGYDLKSIQISVNSDNNDSRYLEVDFSKNNIRIKEAVYNIFKSLGIDNCDASIDFTEEDFVNDRALYVYDISPVWDGLPPPRHGNIKIDLKFSKQTADPLTVICYTEIPTVLNIDKTKQVFFSDFQKA